MRTHLFGFLRAKCLCSYNYPSSVLKCVETGNPSLGHVFKNDDGTV